MDINFADHHLTLHASGVILWPQKQIGIVSDLHLEKGSHFAKRGFFLPPYDSQETLERLLRVVQENDLKRLIILGDSFHDAGGYERLSPQAHDLFSQLEKFHPIWIKGNHDSGFVPPHFEAYEEIVFENITFRHQAVTGSIHEISGHFHPKVFLNNGRMQRDCFITDSRKLILPAFGSYTGGLSVQSFEIRSLFGTECDIYALGENKVYRVPLTHIE